MASSRWAISPIPPILRSPSSRTSIRWLPWKCGRHFHLSITSRSLLLPDLDTIENAISAQWQGVTDGTPLEELDLPKRCYNALMRVGYDCVEQLLDMNDDELLEVRNLGRQSLADLRHALDSYIADHPDRGPAHVIDTRSCVEGHVRWRVFRPTHSLAHPGARANLAYDAGERTELG